MKFEIIFHLLVLVLEISLSTSEKTELPSEGKMKWNIDIDDMLEFDKYKQPEPSQTHTYSVNEVKNAQGEIQNQKCDESHEDMKNYIKRFINLFLVTCGLEVLPESSGNIKVDLEFSISKTDLSFLHDLTKNFSLEKMRDNLQRLDTIFENGLLLKQESLLLKSQSFIQYLANFINNSSLFYSKTFYYVLLLIMTVLMAVLTNISKVITLILTCNNFVLIEGIFDYVHKMKVAQTEDFVRQLRASIILDACDPNNRSLWTRITEFFTTDSCLNYHMTFVESKTVQVSLIKCILDSYNNILLTYPFKVFGASINVFSENISGSMPFKWISVFFMNIFVLISIFLLFVCLLKPRFRLSFFGAGLDLDFSSVRRIPLKSYLKPTEDRRMQEIHGGEISAIMGEKMGDEKENPSELKDISSTKDESIRNSEDKSDPELPENKEMKKHKRCLENGKEDSMLEGEAGAPSFRMPEQSNDYRVVVFGAGGVGKSSLVLRFVKGTFKESYIPTIEDTYRQVISCNKNICTLQITDTTGSHQFPAMQRLSISKGHAFILVYSVTSRQSLEELKPIWEVIKEMKGAELTNIPVMLVGNKCDETENREVETSVGESQAQQWGSSFMETSAKTNHNVKELFQQLLNMEKNRNISLQFDGKKNRSEKGTAKIKERCHIM